jgi:hypothetical protein
MVMIDELRDDVSDGKSLYTALSYSFRESVLRGVQVLRLYDCKHFYCINSLKGLFKQSNKDSTPFPPRCCGTHTPLGLITMELTKDDLDAFRNAEIEPSTKDKIYCSNFECGSFIPLT